MKKPGSNLFSALQSKCHLLSGPGWTIHSGGEGQRHFSCQGTPSSRSPCRTRHQRGRKQGSQWHSQRYSSHTRCQCGISEWCKRRKRANDTGGSCRGQSPKCSPIWASFFFSAFFETRSQSKKSAHFLFSWIFISIWGKWSILTHICQMVETTKSCLSSTSGVILYSSFVLLESVVIGSRKGGGGQGFLAARQDLRPLLRHLLKGMLTAQEFDAVEKVKKYVEKVLAWDFSFSSHLAIDWFTNRTHIHSPTDKQYLESLLGQTSGCSGTWVQDRKPEISLLVLIAMLEEVHDCNEEQVRVLTLTENSHVDWIHAMVDDSWCSVMSNSSADRVIGLTWIQRNLCLPSLKPLPIVTIVTGYTLQGGIADEHQRHNDQKPGKDCWHSGF